MKNGQEYRPYKKFIGAVLPNNLMRYKGISDGAKLCFARLCQYNGKNGSAFPSLETLGKEMAVDRRTAKRRVDELIEHKLIEVEYKTGKTNTYKFIWNSKILEKTDIEDEPTSDNTDMGGMTDMTLGGDNTDTGGMTDMSLGDDNIDMGGVTDLSWGDDNIDTQKRITNIENHIIDEDKENNIKEKDNENNVRDTEQSNNSYHLNSNTEEENTESNVSVSVSVDGKDIRSIFDDFCNNGNASRTTNLVDSHIVSRYSRDRGLTYDEKDIIFRYSEKLSKIHHSDLEKKVNQKVEKYFFPQLRNDFDIRDFMEFLVS